MATTIPAVKAKFGSTEYFLTTMKAEELVQKLKIPKELTDWEDMTIEERFQREINYTRVKKHMAPYLVNDDDRFFGALIVDIYNSDGVEFEPLDEVLTKLPKIYKQAATGFGFLHLTGGEVLVPLDGQHRLAAFRFAISGKDEKGKDIEEIIPNIDIANDDVTVILVKHDERKARKIFNKVNRYAKSTSKADNLITADDDIIAVITREIANQLISERLVNFQSNTLNKRSHQFTTLSTLYDINQKILENRFGKIDITKLPDKAKQLLFRKEIETVWDLLLNEVEIFKLCLSDQSESGDEKRREIREDFLLGKPIAQLSFVSAFLRMREAEKSDGSKFSNKDIVERLNSIDWKIANPVWQRVLMNGERIVAGRQAAMFASRFIAYLAGEPLQEIEKNALEENYRNLFSSDEKDKIKLPPAVFS